MANGLDLLSKVVFSFASVALMLLAAALIVYAGVQIAGAWDEREGAIGAALMDAVAYVVIAIAIFDAAKYLLEEEVVRGREMRHAGEARRSLTKFVSTISIAVLLEALVTVSEAAKADMKDMLYPTLLLLSGVALIVGLGVFQRLSAAVEAEVGGESGEIAEEAKADKTRAKK